MRTRAPAKINWTLEVLGRREDGYHEIRSVMQTIDLCDEVVAERSEMSVFETVEGKRLADDDLVLRAAKALEGRVGRALPARIQLTKRIPMASGLGGGSSDAAAVLRLLNRLHELRLSEAELSEVGASVGSDVPFFAYGGTALVEGRGERVTSLPNAQQSWLAVIVPQIELANKTRTMYERLTAADYSDGLRTEKVLVAVSSDLAVNDHDTFNVFDRHVYDIVDGLEDLSLGLFVEGLFYVHIAGAGPAIFVYCDEKGWADSLAEYAVAFTGGTAEAFVVRTLGRPEATSIFAVESGSPH